MAGHRTTRFTTVRTGPYNQRPVAVLAHANINTLIGAIIQLDGRKSYDPEKKPLTYHWRFVQVPIGSEAESAGFKDIRPNSTAVSFIPDKTGLYVVELKVNDGELDSLPITATVNVQLSHVPVGENIVPDAQFLWDYISDFWKLVEDREKITTIWSSVIQLIGAELTALWGNDYNKSLQTIQPTYQRRWQRFSMLTDLSEVAEQRVIVGKVDSGVAGTSGNLGVIPGVGNTSVFYVPLGRVGDGDRTDFTNLLGNYGPKGRVLVINGKTYTISRVVNEDLLLASGSDLVTTFGLTTVTAASGPFGEADIGDVLVIKAGDNAGSYKIKEITDPTTAVVVYLSDPPGGPTPSFQTEADQSFQIVRQFSLAVVSQSEIPEGLVNANWRVPHLLHVPGLDLEAEGVRAGDVVVFEVSRADIGLTTEIQAQVVGSDGERLGFEFTLNELDPSVNEGSGASVVESGGVTTVSGLQNIRPTSVGGYIEVLNGDNPGTYRILEVIGDDAVVLDHPLASGVDAGNPNIQWIERGKTGGNIDREIFKKVVQDLRIVPPTASSDDVAAAVETLIRYVPVAVNLSTRPFSRFGITFRARRILHHTSVRVSDELVSAPVLQEAIADPPVVLRENLDYVLDGGYLTFVEGLFGPRSQAPDTLWAEYVILDNSATVERNFGRLVNLLRDDLTKKRTRVPYLSAVKGLFFAFTNGPKVANMRLGLQILLGLPFAEERCVILEVQKNFTTDTNGTVLDRVLVEDLDENNRKTGYRRVYFYPNAVGLELNPATRAPYKAGDLLPRFAPISKGVEVSDYIKDPLWWKRALYGLEILKYFTFKVTVAGEVFDSNDVQFALEFINAIKPKYTRVVTTALSTLSDDIKATDSVTGRVLLKFYDDPWGLEATRRSNDMNQQGAVLWNVGSYPFSTRTVELLRDVTTWNDSGVVKVTSETGWDSSLLRGRAHDSAVLSGFDEGRLPPQEGDIFCILAGQSGSSELAPGLYEIESVIDDYNLVLGWQASGIDPDQYAVAELEKPALDPSMFNYGSNLVCCILRRENPTVLWGDDLVTDGTHIAASASAQFLKNNVRVGDTLCIELGSNLGEFFVDVIANEGSSASVSAPTAGVSTVTGLTDMGISSVGGTLELMGALNQGVFKIVEFIDPTSVKIRCSTALVEAGVAWRETPRAPFIQEDRVALKNADGSYATLSASSGQRFRVVRPFFHRAVVNKARYFYNSAPSEAILQVEYNDDHGIGLSSEWRDIFTPGMVGLPISISESDDPANDGEFIITRYINSGRVVIDNPSTASEPSPGNQRINFLRSP